LAAELMEAAAHWERSAALCDAPAVKAEKVLLAEECRSAAAECGGHGSMPVSNYYQKLGCYLLYTITSSPLSGVTSSRAVLGHVVADTLACPPEHAPLRLV